MLIDNTRMIKGNSNKLFSFISKENDKTRAHIFIHFVSWLPSNTFSFAFAPFLRFLITLHSKEIMEIHLILS